MDMAGIPTIPGPTLLSAPMVTDKPEPLKGILGIPTTAIISFDMSALPPIEPDKPLYERYPNIFPRPVIVPEVYGPSKSAFVNSARNLASGREW